MPSRCRCIVAIITSACLEMPLRASDESATDPRPYRVVLNTPAAPVLACAADSVFVSIRTIASTGPNLDEIANTLPSTVQGISVDDIVRFCRAKSFPAMALKTNLRGLQLIGAPTILFVNRRHFIVYLGDTMGQMKIFDNALGLIECTSEWFSKAYAWDGTSIVIGQLPLSIAVQLHWREIAYAVVILCVCLLLVRWRLGTRQRRFRVAEYL